ncbi:hypothetical protein HF1_11370 [Mycoplasma haemofelis str. Langford 1]|uniref:Uncharacterized protein n=1 Tax=Mycoplasma haemofelis (strain Langford 1) TaxID=941640 RepID=E8ZJ24_MYCHL|nr:hypothetical protein [Mycoplasma haemofelis]CBY93145.1 hypothetical protein HF1_11370 [Mycoplasma haemofelis str. Langford 1]
MANSLLFKSLAGIGGVSAVTGAAIGIPKLLEDKGELISELIKTKNPNKRLITSQSLEDADWKKSWEDYRKANKNAKKGEDSFQLSDWSGSITTDITDSTASQSLLNACSSNSKKRVVESSQLYKDVLNYCTRDTLISDLLKESGKTPLLKSEAANSAGWKAAWERYRIANKDKDSDDWKLQDFNGQKNQASQQAWETFRTQCETNLNSKDISKSVFLEQVKDWCTVEGI